MIQVSFMDKLEILKEVISSSFFSIIVLLIIIFIGFLFATTNKHNAKDSKKIYILAYAVSLLALLIQYGSSLGELFDYFMNNVFTLIYFPNLAVYLLAIIITNIIMWKTMFKGYAEKPVKILNSTAFCLLHYLLFLILMTINEKNLNIFEVSSVYGNKTALALIELSSAIFIFWLLLLGIYKLIRRYQNRQGDLVLDEVPVYSKFNLQRPIVVKTIPDQVWASKLPGTKPVLEIKSNQGEKQLQEQVPTKTASSATDLYDSMLTVEDYKLLLQLLKEQKNQKQQIKTVELDEQTKLMELQDLYKSIR